MQRRQLALVAEHCALVRETPQATKQTTAIRPAPKAMACWRNSFGTSPAIRASRSNARPPAAADDDPEVARGVILGPT